MVVAILVIVGVNALLLARAPGRTNSEAPPFSGRLTTGERASLADYRGKVVLLDFWATWCYPCVQEMPVLERVQRRFAGRPFSVVGVNAEGHGTVDATQIAEFMRGRGASYPSFVDDGAIVEQYRVDSIPHMLLLDREGKVRRVYSGGVGEQKLAADVEAALR